MKPITIILFSNAIIPVFNFCLPDKIAECLKQAKNQNTNPIESLEIDLKLAKQEDEVSDQSIGEDNYPDYYSDQDNNYNDEEDISLESRSIARYGYPCKPRYLKGLIP